MLQVNSSRLLAGQSKSIIESVPRLSLIDELVLLAVAAGESVQATAQIV